jgi:hypothetical protein
MSHPLSKDDNPDAPSNPVNSTNSDHNDDDKDKIILSLMREPYKSIMHAHFRLLGSDKVVGGNEVEKAVAERVLARLLSSRNGGGDAVASAAGDSKMKLYKLIRYGKGAIESVDHDWAFHSELYLYSFVYIRLVDVSFRLLTSNIYFNISLT